MEELAGKLAQRSYLSDRTIELLGTSRSTVTPFWWGLKTLIQYRMIKDYRNPAVRFTP